MPLAFYGPNLIYFAGFGDVAFAGFGDVAGSPIGVLKITTLDTPMEIGADALGKPERREPATFIHFECVESLDVLIGVLGEIRERMTAGDAAVSADTVRTGEQP